MTEKAARLLVDEFLSYPDEFYIQFVKECFAASEEPQVADLHRAAALAMARQAGLEAAFGCLRAWVTTDLRPDLSHVSVPALVIHGDHDVVVPYEGSGERTHRALADSEVHLIRGGPHSCHIANASEFNEVLVGFLSRGAARGSADASLDSAGP
jgi:pimeloyl-ACP methyl ester carboxylesterase